MTLCHFVAVDGKLLLIAINIPVPCLLACVLWYVELLMMAELLLWLMSKLHVSIEGYTKLNNILPYL